MTVTEFATLEVLPPHDTHSPAIQDFFRKVAELQSTASGYRMRFFQNANAPATLYILAGWPDATIHQKWIESEGNNALLAEMQTKVAVKGLVHLEVDFTKIPSDATRVRVTTYPNEVQSRLKVDGTEPGGPLEWSGVCGSLESNGTELYYLQVWTDGKAKEEAFGGAEAGGATADVHMIRLPYEI
ncbi:hypothetical protein BDY19DRAFT_918828 [Irpex rosettiformis]|uniref:Uncharacterized protein n=1 Tax=Irpex rosettiformis TaxID=378272 RepID=A0ACB8UHJ1_9APHY|nr:hypothetical protein BDY19DRAFT_918828 [Irpex rosettiformis]